MRYMFLPPLCAGLLLLAGTTMARAQTSARTGNTQEARRATDALNILESRGYCAGLQERSKDAFADFRQHGNDFVAKITQKGRDFTVTVNPETRRVSRGD